MTEDAEYWHLPGSDDLGYIQQQPEPAMVVRVLTPRGKEYAWRTGDVFSIWDTRLDDWWRNAIGHRRTWKQLKHAELALKEELDDVVANNR